MELNIPSIIPARARFDEAVFNRLFLDNYAKLCEIAYRIVGDRDDAEDLVGEAFWRLWNRPPGHHENILGWLYRVVTNLAYNALRSAQRRVRREQQNYYLSEQLTSPSADQLYQKRLEIAAVRRTLEKMARRDVQLLILRYSGLSYQEISSALAIAPGSVGTLLARAEKKFAALHQKGEEDAPER